MSYSKRLLVNTVTFISLSVLLPDHMFYVNSLWYALLASFILSVLNLLVKPILHLLSLPITLITFVLFSFVINALILQFTASVVGAEGFGCGGFGSALVVAILMSIINAIIRDHYKSKYY